MKKELNTYIVEGGIGKNTAFTALVSKLRKKDNNSIQIYTPYVDIFAYNPDVKMAFDSTSIPLQDPRIMESDNIFYCEPYKSNFQFGKQHIIESYCNLLGIDFESKMKPELYTSHLESRAKDWLIRNNIIGKYLLVQFTGGQSPVGWNINNQYTNINPGRIYPQFLAQQVINKLKELDPGLTIIDCSLPNEPGYMNTIKCTEHWTIIHELLKNSQGFIAVDSCLNHFSASTKTVGVVIWGSTRWTQFGYSHNINLHYHMKDKWDESKYIENDPRNVMVDPDIIIKSYKERNKLNKNQTKEVYCQIK